MSENGDALDKKTLKLYQEKLTELGYEVYKVSGSWYANDVDYERNPNFADGPYTTKEDAIETTFNNLGLELDEDEEDTAEPSSPTLG